MGRGGAGARGVASGDGPRLRTHGRWSALGGRGALGRWAIALGFLCQALGQGTLEAPILAHPRFGAVDAPPRLISVVLTFAEEVATGTQGILLVQGSGCGRNNAVDCSGLLVAGRSVIAPLEETLEPGCFYNLEISSTCLFAGDGSGRQLEGTGRVQLGNFTTAASWTSGQNVSFVNEANVTATWTPLLRPRPGDYVPPGHTPFSLQFTEAVQRGQGKLRWYHFQFGGLRLHDELEVSTAPFNRLYIDPVVPGRVVLASAPLQASGEYSLQWDEGAFVDGEGVAVAASSDRARFGDVYAVRLGSSLTSMYPWEVTLPRRDNVTPYTNVVLEFDRVVRPGPAFATPGGSGVVLCGEWRSGVCSPEFEVEVPQDGVHFLGNTVLLNPAVDLGFYTEYHLFVSGESFFFFSGIHTSSAIYKGWSFRTEPDRRRFDSGPPVLVTVRPDCDGDGEVSPNVTCALEDGGQALAEAEVLFDTPPMLPLGSRLFLFFREAVNVTGALARLVRANGPVVVTGEYPVAVSMNDTRGGSSAGADCLVALSPTLAPGADYTLHVGGDVITDRYGNDGRGVRYGGTRFSFTTPLGRPVFTRPVNKTGGVNTTVALQITFAGYPEPVPGAINVGELVDVTAGSTRLFPLADADEVQFQGHHIRIAPEPPLSSGRSYRFRLLHKSVRFLLADVILEFDTLSNSTSVGVGQNTTGPDLTTLQYSLPSEGGVPVPGNTDISLYFSGAVRAANGPKLVYVVEEGDPNHHMIPVDNSDPSQGRVTVFGRTVFIDPRRDLSPGRQVEVHFRTGTFVDFGGRPLEGVGYFTSRPAIRFRTLEPVLGQVRSNGSWALGTLPTLEGAELHWSAGRWLLVAGQRPGTCFPRAFTSARGDAWEEVAYATPANVANRSTSPASSPTTVAIGVADGAATAADEQGCIVLLGGRCDGNATSVLWRSCDGAASWTALPPPLSVLVSNSAPPVPWPESFDGHAMVVLGGWRLVVADGARRAVWSFLYHSMALVERHVPPWDARRDPLLVATGSGSLVLVGGTACADWSGNCSAGGRGLKDVWLSDDRGRSWRCLSAAASLGVGWARGGAALAAAHDGALLLLDAGLGLAAGDPSSARGLSAIGDMTRILVASSEPKLLEDLEQPPRLLVRHPSVGEIGVPGSQFQAVLTFSSTVSLGGNLASPAILTDLANNSEVPLEVSALGPVVILAARRPLAPDAEHRVELRAPVFGSDGRLASAVGAWTFRTAAQSSVGVGAGAAPLLQSIFPPPEDPQSPTHLWATSRPLYLTFSETLQLGTAGGVRFTGRAVGPVVSVGPRGGGAGRLHVAGRKAVVVAEGLLPGEVYDVVLEAGTFTSASGDPCRAANWTISYAHFVDFQPIRDSRAALGIPGRRSASAFAVSTSNDVLVVGGTEVDVSGAGTSRLNDAWMLRTGRHINCASAEEEPRNCSQQHCSATPPFFGRSVRRWVIWRSPSLGGRPCIDSGAGMPRSNLGQVVGTQQEDCDCPRCPGAPPAPLPEHMVNTGLEGFALARADVDSRPLVCAEGFRPNGSFRCSAVNRHYGDWDTYPSCVPADCTAAPEIAHRDLRRLSSSVEECGGLGWRPNATSASPSATYSHANTTFPNASSGGMLHGASCSFSCLPGYRPSGLLHCLYGRYQGSCVKRFCPAPVAPEGAVLNCDAAAPELLSRCWLQCKPGWVAQGLAYWECSAAAAAQEVGGAPGWLAQGQCVRKECGPPPRWPHAEPFEASNVTLGSRAPYRCKGGYQLSVSSDLELRCEVEDSRAGTVTWKGHIACERRPCLSGPSDPRGSFRCSPDDGLTGDRCQLMCPPGFEVTLGDGVHVCDGETYVRNGSCTPQPCGRPTLVPDAVGLAPDCPEPVRHGEECRVVCRAAHTEVGRYHCHEGVFAQRPACVFSGTAAVVEHAAEAALQADIRAIASNSRQPSQSGMEAVLDAALVAIGIRHSVSEVRVAMQAGRRLDASTTAADAHGPTEVSTSERHLQGASLGQQSNYTLSVSWRVMTPDNSMARDVSQALRSNEAAFGDAFKISLMRDFTMAVETFRVVTAVPALRYLSPLSSGSTTLTQDESNADLISMLSVLFGCLVGLSCLVVAVVFVAVLARTRAKARRAEEREEARRAEASALEPVSDPFADVGGAAGGARGADDVRVGVGESAADSPGDGAGLDEVAEPNDGTGAAVGHSLDVAPTADVALGGDAGANAGDEAEVPNEVEQGVAGVRRPSASSSVVFI